MATTKEKEKPTATTAVAKTNGAEISATVKSEDGKVLSVDEIAARLNELDFGAKIETKYFSFDEQEGVKVKMFIHAMTKIRKIGSTEGEMVDAVAFVGEDGQQYINADAVIVSKAKQMKLPTALGVVYKTMTKGPKGNYRDFDFFELVG